MTIIPTNTYITFAQTIIMIIIVIINFPTSHSLCDCVRLAAITEEYMFKMLCSMAVIFSSAFCVVIKYDTLQPAYLFIIQL